MSKTPDCIACVADLSHRYGDTLAVDAINLEIPAGCMVGLVGPDGVGKSSLLALISGVRKIQQGTVEVLDGDIGKTRHRTQVCPRIAYMPQGLGRNLYMTLSVFENMDFFGRLFGQDREERKRRIDELLTGTGLAPFRDRPAGKLSGGMKQKLGLCCALIHDPDLLILDEPTTGVDPLSRRQFWELINRIRARRKGMSVLVSTAYMEEAEAFDWLVAMDDGKVLATGTPEKLLEQTGTNDLDSAFIHLLPEEKRRGHKTLVVPPRVAQADGPPAIKAEGLTRRFGDFTAVDHVNFEIERGEIFGFLGSNGCGKTTTMKMLTGLLPVSEGKAKLFGQSVDAHDLETRKRVGFMSQGFSLYSELTVRQNLELHARLFHLPKERIAARVNEMVNRFVLKDFTHTLAARLPLGIRQRLSLAVAVIHAPEMLILDEPTSGVDPVARDSFWELLIDLSRNQGVTIFISTHFMNEAERCDRISLMHAGKVLAQGTPSELVRARSADTLEEAFIAYLENVGREAPEDADRNAAPIPEPTPVNEPAKYGSGPPSSLGRIWAYVRRESTEIRRDPIRLVFALLGPLILMIVFGYGISFDVENLPYAVLDRDQTPESRTFLENFEGSRYFEERPPINDLTEMEHRLRRGELRLAIEIPPDFGKDLKKGRQPEIGAWLDGAMPFRAETSRGYVQGVYLSYLKSLARRELGEEIYPLSVDIETRYRYNQDFKSVFAMVPGVIMLILAVIPAMLTAVGVVREKELGSITNLYATPVTGLEFLLGKQFPYIVIALVNFLSLMLLALFLFRVPVQGSFSALAVGAILYVISTTGFGLLVSTFVKTQVAAIFGAAIITLIPAVNFSGFLKPVASQSLTGKAMGYSFPSVYFDHISVGTFSKALGFGDLSIYYVALMIFIVVYLGLARLLLRNQER